ncbi:hypothetical protein [Shewanella sp. Actino-trap-3]|jgi:hypothetical protein|uniref:hypothetical protein n=1 Tax=Shewanella sp. Actino-trap-3 TaxID=2058331 RepID=UPI0012FE8E7E|nr:hypothetical protein [Shewanella sp. Actino-trap-3]|tara:strand:+ start:22044 stop:22217 length:174 start_codon:yes stop_codon:yes gene_type:complete
MGSKKILDNPNQFEPDMNNISLIDTGGIMTPLPLVSDFSVVSFYKLQSSQSLAAAQN